jgi:hypothetical protein
MMDPHFFGLRPGGRWRAIYVTVLPASSVTQRLRVIFERIPLAHPKSLRHSTSRAMIVHTRGN